MAPETPADIPPHAEDAAEVARRLTTDVRDGLAADEARRRRAEHGPNELPREVAPPWWRVLLRQFANVLILILAGAIVLSVLVGEAVEAVAIGLIAAFTVVLGFVQEFRAQRSMEALRELAAPRAHVVRDGRAQDVPARDVVPGDVFLLAEGDIVPADGRLVQAAQLQVNESALTGESLAVEKKADGHVAPDASLGDRATMAYAGTIVNTGRGRAVATATGTATEVGHIGRLLAGVEIAKTPLERQLARFGRWLVAVATVLVGLIVGLGLARGGSVFEMLLFGVALAVAIVPEALPAVVTISLALGAQRMARRHALIRRLPTVETLGSTTVICTDKTGTLTAGHMVVAEIAVADQVVTFTGAGYATEGTFDPVPTGEAEVAFRRALRAVALCTDASVDATGDEPRIHGDPTEAALIVAAGKAGLDKATLEREEPRETEIGFTSDRKRMTTVHRAAHGIVAYSKGAPEIILDACDRRWSEDGIADLADEERKRMRAAAQAMAERGMRVLAVSFRENPPQQDVEAGHVLLAFVGIRDPPRPEALDAIRTCHAAGIRPVMITGDHPATANAIASELGILRDGRTVSGRELDGMDQKTLADQVSGIDVFARVSPAHKLRIIDALQERGEVVAMTGDGVNDAPALRKADIGVAMGITGTDVAKQAASMTLADDNFATIVAAVEEGRGIFDNVRKYLVYLLSTNLGEVTLIAATLVLGLPLPLSAVMILYVNLASDGLPALALAVDPREPDIMERAPRAPGRPILERAVLVLMVLGGAWSAAANLAVFTWALGRGLPLEEAMTMTFVSLVIIQFVKAYVFRTERASILRRPFENKWLNIAVLWEIALLLLLVYVPLLQVYFGTVPLSPTDWLIVGGAAFTTVPVLEAAKWAERHEWFGAVEGTTKPRPT